MIATSLKDEESGLLHASSMPNSKILPLAIIYGANASGKSNVVDALQFMQRAIRLSQRQGNPEGGVPTKPFRLRHEDHKVSEFDVDILVNNIRYHYGFKVDKSKFTEEWLYSFPQGRRQMLFERGHAKQMSFGRSLKGRNKIISELMRDNSLFLSAAMQNGHEELAPLGNFFNRMIFNNAISVAGGAINISFKDVDVDSRTIAFLQKVGTGITGFRRKQTEQPANIVSLQKALYEVISKQISGIGEPREYKIESHETTVELSHRSSADRDIFFKPDEESAGTRRLLMLVSQAYNALDTGSILVIDELDASIHTQACELIISIFSNGNLNKKNAQVIATTHDTNMMGSKLLRRDQIWFTEKDAEGSTHLFPLSDIKTRRSDNIERGYLQGRFGAIPYSGSIEELFEVC